MEKIWFCYVKEDGSFKMYLKFWIMVLLIWFWHDVRCHSILIHILFPLCIVSCLCLSLGCSTTINNNRATNQRPSCHHHMQLLTVKPNQPRHPQTNQISHHQRQQNSPEPPPPHHTTPPKTTKPKQLLWYNYIYGFRFITWYTFCLALYH